MTGLSIIVPAYNEERRLGATLASIAAFAAAQDRAVEVIVVDDGSSDATSDVAGAYAGRIPDLRVLRTDSNRGKGHAVRRGMLAATGELRLFTDADGSTPIDEVERLEEALRVAGGSGVAFGSIAGGEHVERGESSFRSFAGRVGNRLIQALLLKGVTDSQRGFKLFSGEAADDLFGRCVVDGWAFDVEVLTLARRSGYAMCEVETRWRHHPDTKVTPLSYVTTLGDVLRIRWRLLRGAYGPATPHLRNTPV